MAFSSFRDFVEALERAGELKRISQPVATELEITELANREMKTPGGGKALLIEKPTVNGQVSPFPVAINTMGSWKRMAISMGAASVDDVAAELGALVKAKPPTSFREALKLLGTALEMRHARPKRVSTGPARTWCTSSRILPTNAELAAGAGLEKSCRPRPTSPDSARSSHSQMLAARWGAFHHIALCRDARSRHR